MPDLPTAPGNPNRWIWLLFALGFVLTIFFGYRAVRSFARVRQVQLQAGLGNVDIIRPWMTFPFISHAYDIPKEYLYQQTNIPSQGNDRKNLGELNREYFPAKPDYVLETVKQVISAYNQRYSTPTNPAQRPVP